MNTKILIISATILIGLVILVFLLSKKSEKNTLKSTSLMLGASSLSVNNQNTTSTVQIINPNTYNYSKTPSEFVTNQIDFTSNLIPGTLERSSFNIKWANEWNNSLLIQTKSGPIRTTDEFDVTNIIDKNEYITGIKWNQRTVDSIRVCNMLTRASRIIKLGLPVPGQGDFEPKWDRSDYTDDNYGLVAIFTAVHQPSPWYCVNAIRTVYRRVDIAFNDIDNKDALYPNFSDLYKYYDSLNDKLLNNSNFMNQNLHIIFPPAIMKNINYPPIAAVAPLQIFLNDNNMAWFKPTQFIKEIYKGFINGFVIKYKNDPSFGFCGIPLITRLLTTKDNDLMKQDRCAAKIIDCVVSDWNNGVCDVNGNKTRTRTIITPPQNGGSACPPLTDVQNNVCDVDCVLNDWVVTQDCDTNANGFRIKERSIKVLPKNNGKKCDNRVIKEPCTTSQPFYLKSLYSERIDQTKNCLQNDDFSGYDTCGNNSLKMTYYKNDNTIRNESGDKCLTYDNRSFKYIMKSDLNNCSKIIRVNDKKLKDINSDNCLFYNLRSSINNSNSLSRGDCNPSGNNSSNFDVVDVNNKSISVINILPPITNQRYSLNNVNFRFVTPDRKVLLTANYDLTKTPGLNLIFSGWGGSLLTTYNNVMILGNAQKCDNNLNCYPSSISQYSFDAYINGIFIRDFRAAGYWDVNYDIFSMLARTIGLNAINPTSFPYNIQTIEFSFALDQNGEKKKYDGFPVFNFNIII